MAQPSTPGDTTQSPPQTVSGDMADESQLTGTVNWKPSRHQKAIIYTIGVLNLIVALDASIIVTSLAVGVLLHDHFSARDECLTAHCRQS